MNTIFESLVKIKFDGVEYDVKYYLGCDLKFLALALGVGYANSHHPCPWCETEKKYFVENIHGYEMDRTFDNGKFVKIM